MSDLDRAEAPAGVLALALALGLMACGSASPDCPDDIQTLFREQKPHVELLACEETRPGVRPGEIQEQVTFTFEYRYFPGGKSRFDVWTYDLLGNGELRPHSSGEIVFVDLPSDTVRNGEAADATTYRFTISELSAATDETTESTGRAWASGEMFRVQYENKEKSHIVVSSGAGSPTFAVDPESKTYHDLDAHTASALDMSPWQKSRIEDLATELEETDDSKMIRGWSARRHVLRVSFTVATDYGSEVAKERFEATLSLWTAPELDGPEPLAEIDPRRLDLSEIMDPVRKPPAEQVEEVERQIAEDLASIGGFPLEGRLELTRHFAGGEPRVSGRTVMLDRFEKVDVPASAFRVPASFAERAPEVDPPRRSLPR